MVKIRSKLLLNFVKIGYNFLKPFKLMHYVASINNFWSFSVNCVGSLAALCSYVVYAVVDVQYDVLCGLSLVMNGS